MLELSGITLSGITKEYRVGGQTVRALDGIDLRILIYNAMSMAVAQRRPSLAVARHRLPARADGA